MKNTRKFLRSFSVFMTVNLLVQMGLPTVSWALTSGPSSPETQQFAPAGMDNMVDPFTGDFSYNIPLMDVGGYPINLNYAAGINPDAEASWVGLGWNLNVGAINRSVRGLPDDFAGAEDKVTKTYNVKPNETIGLNIPAKLLELWGFPFGKAMNMSLSYNNYNGFGYKLGFSPSLNAPLGKSGNIKLGVNASLDTESGVGISPSIGLSAKQKDGTNETTLGATISFPYSTREGLKGMSMQGSFNSCNTQKFVNNGKEATEKSNFSGGSSAFLGFASPTYTPSLSHDAYNVDIGMDFTYSYTENIGTEPRVTSLSIGGYYAGQFLKNTKKESPAYGYLYSGLSDADNVLHDFNKEKDGGFNLSTSNLPVTNYTYDIFSVSGQGVGGTYRLYRGDVGSVYEPSQREDGYSIGTSFGVGLGLSAYPAIPTLTLEPGANFNYSASVSQKWDHGYLQKFSNNNIGYNSFKKEAVYFKKIGDMAPEADAPFLAAQQGFTPYRYDMYNYNGGYLSGKSIDINGTSSNIVKAERTERRTRNTQFTYLTARDAQMPNYTSEQIATSGFPVMPIYDYKALKENKSTFNARSITPSLPRPEPLEYTKNSLPRVDGNKKAHHISEVRVTDNSGARYVYGIPVYNTKQKETTFNVKKKSYDDPKKGLVTYESGEKGTGNKVGLDHMFEETETKPYATSYLLTCVLSSDYVDSDNIPGPSDGDRGTYTRFNYTKWIDNFKWRTPYGKNQGSFTEGLEGTENDDKANVVYGEKEIWYLHSIETRTHVAEFYLSPRADGLPVAGEDGGQDASDVNRLQKLDKIKLYSKQDMLNGKREPLKVVHLDYDYLLCPETDNSVAGPSIANPAVKKAKLTLTKVWFTYGNSGKGVLNPYVFNYAEDLDGDMKVDNLNPNYSLKGYDRWGNYKPDLGVGNQVDPYAEQDKEKADDYSRVYNLSSIQTPTGGSIKVHYEADDYAYVQNKQAMRMFKVLGTSNEGATNLNGTNTLTVDLGEGFKLPSGTSADAAKAYFLNNYIGDMNLLHYRIKLNVVNGVGGEPTYNQVVPGYAEIDKGNCTPILVGDTYKKATIALQPVSGRNPITKNGWMFAKLNLGRQLKGLGDAGDNGLRQVLGGMLSNVRSIIQMVVGFNNFMDLAGHSKQINITESFVRLNDGSKKKLGGGHRVKALVMSDNWNLMKSQNTSQATKETAQYGQMYDYTYQEDTGEKTALLKPIYRPISAGVAAYEPMMGGEENPFRQPVFVKEKVPLAPSREYYLEEPFGESFFPAPTVGYRQVIVTPIKVESATYKPDELASNNTGFVEHQFYTAYDFPTITKRTTIDIQRQSPNLLATFFKFGSADLVTALQGYYVELNDMHGKAKSQKVMPSGGGDDEPISYVEYVYKTNKDNTLNNQVRYINKALGIVSETVDKQLGVDIDVVNDHRYFSSSTKGGGLDINIKFSAAPAGPIPLPLFALSGMPEFVSDFQEFKSVVTTKVVNRYGILQKTIAKDNGQTITTENLAWDEKTGEVLLTKVENEFHDPVWNFNIPGYWAYKEMDLASTNENLVFDNLTTVISQGAIKEGDEFLLINGTDKKIAYYDAQRGLLAKNGQAAGDFKKAILIRSGGRNMPMTSIGSISCLEDPLAGSTLNFKKVLNAGAVEFSNVWKAFCNCGESLDITTANPFVIGRKGFLRPIRSWTYLTQRTQSQTNNNLNIRRDGYFADEYVPFWVKSTDASADRLKRVDNVTGTKWQSVTEIQNYNPVGMEVENKDALERFSSAQFGYARNLPVATSNNSQYKESGFDGFEDYDYGDCNDDHFSWRANKPNVTNKESHTGKKAIKVPKGTSLKITKIISPCE